MGRVIRYPRGLFVLFHSFFIEIAARQASSFSERSLFRMHFRSTTEPECLLVKPLMAASVIAPHEALAALTNIVFPHLERAQQWSESDIRSVRTEITDPARQRRSKCLAPNTASLVWSVVWSIAAMSGSSSVKAQVTSPIPHSPTSNVKITRLQQERDRFPGILDDNASKSQFESAFVVHNADLRDIVAIYAVWKVVDHNGQTHTSGFMSDIYAAVVPNTVIPSGKDAVISPSGWIFPQTYRKSTVADQTGSSGLTTLDILLANATSVSLSIDAVIFADGETCGENTIGLDRAITSRRSAAISLSSKVRASMASSEDWRARAKGEPSFTEDKSSEEFWRGVYARQLTSAASDSEARVHLNFFEKLPLPPTFYPCRSK
jgi:hypothetical protein